MKWELEFGMYRLEMEFGFFLLSSFLEARFWVFSY